MGPFPIRAYALFIIVGIAVAIVVGERRWKARGGEAGLIIDLSLWAVPFGIIGARLYHVLTDWDRFSDNLGAIPKIWAGGLGESACCGDHDLTFG